MSAVGAFSSAWISPEEGGDARWVIGQNAQDCFSQGVLAAPPGIIAGEFEAITFGKADQLQARPGADRRLPLLKSSVVALAPAFFETI